MGAVVDQHKPAKTGAGASGIRAGVELVLFKGRAVFVDHQSLRIRDHDAGIAVEQFHTFGKVFRG
jgi:hypothetical protein